MITVELINLPNKDITSMMSYAARTCYEGSEHQWGKQIDISKRVFNTGHHSILQHANFTFFIEGIAIGDVTFGLHLNAPFYASSQRSGRFCSGMFSDSNVAEKAIDYTKCFFPKTDNHALNAIKQYINACAEIYHQNVKQATAIAEQFIKTERPFASSKYINQNAPKFAQEQLRMFIPVIFPTGLTFTINLLTLATMYRMAWIPPMYHLTDLMVQAVLQIVPELSYMFTRDNNSTESHSQDIIQFRCTQDHPELQLISMDNLHNAIYPQLSETHPVDTLHFNPRFMSNNIIDINTKVKISLATMGQDHRHKTIRRTEPIFTGDFYCPPIVAKLLINKQVLQIFEQWTNISTKVHPALTRLLAPYGAMVTYEKKGNLNAILHEQNKRLCWCTQQEIYDISRQLREAVSEHPNCTPKLLSLLAPNCFQEKKCGEGPRYCGRSLTGDSIDFFPPRKV